MNIVYMQLLVQRECHEVSGRELEDLAERYICQRREEQAAGALKGKRGKGVG